MTKKRRRPTIPPRVASDTEASIAGHLSDSTRNGDDALAASVVRALLARDAPAAPATPTVPPRPPKTLTVTVPPGVAPALATAQLTMRGRVHNALLIEAFSGPLVGDAEQDLTTTLAALDATVAAVQRGELGDAEGLLMAQAVTLNTIFAHCTMQGSRTLEGHHLEGTER
jgi:hypothetical protein